MSFSCLLCQQSEGRSLTGGVLRELHAGLLTLLVKLPTMISAYINCCKVFSKIGKVNADDTSSGQSKGKQAMQCPEYRISLILLEQLSLIRMIRIENMI